MNYKKLFEPYHIHQTHLTNRFVMAPMTRSRSSQPGNCPNALMAEYYHQRSSAGLIITEATQVSLQGMGYAKTPGIYSEEQVKGWMLVTHSVHQKGGKIFLQLWHVGRVSSSQVNGLQPIAPSAIAAKNTSVYIFNPHEKDAVFVPVDHPKEMSQQDIDRTIQEFADGAKNSIRAGFDGVEIHGANGYLIDQFLRSNSNQRTDHYGGSKENRIRFLMEVTNAVQKHVGKEKVGVRLSPFIKFKDMDDPEILETILIVATKLNEMGVAYIHLSEADWEDAPSIPDDFRIELRKRFKGTIIATGNKSPEEGELLLSKGWADLIGFGRRFISNPDYPERVQKNKPLAEIKDTHTLFGGGTSVGYTDYTVSA